MHKKLIINSPTALFILLTFLNVLLLGIPAEVLAKVNTHSYIDGYAGTRIDTWNGNLYYSRRDLYIPARGLSIDLTMSYNLTRRDEDRGFGNGWQLSYDMSYVESTTDVTIRHGGGRGDTFDCSSFPCTPPTGSQDTLDQYGTNGYLLTTKYGMKYYFDTDISGHEKITSKKNSKGDDLTFTYTGTLLTGIEDTHERSVSLSYDNGRLDTVTDSNTTPPREIQYTYDGNGNLTKVTDPEGGEIAYEYFEANNDGTYILNTIIDANANLFTINYFFEDYASGLDGYFVKSTFNGADEIVFGYFVGSNQRTIRYLIDEVLQKMTVHYYDADGHLIGENGKSRTWDADNNVDSRTDENDNTTTYEYDSNGNMTKELSPPVDGVVYSTTYTYIYSDTFGYRTKTHTDANGNPTSYDHDAKGRRIKITEPLGHITQYAYNVDNNLYSKTNPNGIITKYEFDSFGNRNKMIQDPIGLNLITEYAYDTVGNMTKVIDPRDNTITNEYDLLNRLTTITNASLTDTYIYSYDGNGNIIKGIDERGKITRYQYNALNLQTNVIDALLYSTTYEYDFYGNLITKTDARRNSTYFEYSYSICPACGIDKLISVTDDLDNNTIYSHDPAGNILKQTDANGKVTYIKYDSLNQQTMVNRKVGDTVDNVDSDDAVTYYTYDAVGNLIDKIDPNDNTLANTYDALNRVTTISNALGELTIYSYDAMGNRTGKTLANGNTISNQYNGLNRLTLVNDTIGTVAEYAYDGVGNRIAYITANGNITQFEYDVLNRPQYIIDPAPAYNTITNVYDKVGNRTKVIDRNGKVTYYRYDDLNRLTLMNRKMNDTDDIDDDIDDILTTYGYDAVGNRTSITDSNSNITGYSYNVVDRLIQESYEDGTTRTFDYDGVGNILKRVDQNDNTLTNSYDDLHRPDWPRLSGNQRRCCLHLRPGREDG